MDNGKHTVTALTRQDSKGKLPEGVHAVKVDYDSEDSIVNALKGHDFVAITLGVRAPEDLHKRITDAAGKAGVPLIMPNSYGYPLGPEGPKEGDAYGKIVVDRCEDTKNGVSEYLKMSCGFWYEWSLAIGEQWFGFTIKDRKVTFFDDGKRIVTVSTWLQCGRALAALLSLPGSGTKPSLADFKNGDCPIYSFRVSQRDMLDSLHRVLGTTDSDWEITYEPVEKRIEDGKKELAAGQFTGFAKSMYGGIFLASNQQSDFAAKGSANAILGLPQEDLDEATKRTVEMVESGWNPFA